MPDLIPIQSDLARARVDLPALWSDFLAAEVASGQISEATASTYRVGWRRFRSWGEDSGQPTRRVVQQWIASLRGKYAPATVNVWVAGVRAFFDWAVSEGYAPSNPTAGIGSQKRKQSGHKRDVLSDEEMRRLLALDLPSRDRCIIHLLAYTGCRLIEIHRADFEDLRTVDNQMTLRVQGKGRGDKDELLVIAHPAARETVYSYLSDRGEDDGALFRSESNRGRGGRLSLRSLRGIVKSAYRLAGIVGKAKTSHSLRHTAITSAIRHGASIQDVQAMARHSSASTTMNYYHHLRRMDNPAEVLIDYGGELK